MKTYRLNRTEQNRIGMRIGYKWAKSIKGWLDMCERDDSGNPVHNYIKIDDFVKGHEFDFADMVRDAACLLVARVPSDSECDFDLQYNAEKIVSYMKHYSVECIKTNSDFKSVLEYFTNRNK